MEKLAYDTAISERIIRDDRTFKRRLRLAKQEGVTEILNDLELTPTPYFYEALDYGRRAAILQQANLDGKKKRVGDKLQEAIPIYDTTRRQYAGFSNVLEQLWYGRWAPKYEANKDRNFVVLRTPYRAMVREDEQAEIQWLFICLVHRITGSGASFEWDHGWRNNRVSFMAELASVPRMAKFISEYDGPIFTSIGNQIPPFPKFGGREYLKNVAPILVTRVFNWLSHSAGSTGDSKSIQEAVDGVLDIHVKLGCKRFKFVLTAWVMDIAQYLPHLVDPTSDVYHGKNAEETMRICFEKPRGMKNQEYYDRGTRIIARCTDTWPMDVEDVFCDFVRWIENYVPKKGFDHVHQERIFNSSALRWHKGRQPDGA